MLRGVIAVAVLAGLAGLAALSLVTACGGPDVLGDPLGSALPDRLPESDAGAEAGAQRDAGAPPPPVDAGVDAAATSTLCKAPDLAVCFPFESSVTDMSPNAIAPAASNVTFTAGKHGTAASFGATSSVTIGANAAFETAAATMEAWIKRSAAGAAADGVIFDADARYSLTITAAGAVLCKTSGGLVSGGAITNDLWTHVACVVGGGTVRAYVNGAEVASAAGSVASSPTSAHAIGGNSPSGEPFLGAIDSLRIFRAARSAAEIAAAAAP